MVARTLPPQPPPPPSPSRVGGPLPPPPSRVARQGPPPPLPLIQLPGVQEFRVCKPDLEVYKLNAEPTQIETISMHNFNLFIEQLLARANSSLFIPALITTMAWYLEGMKADPEQINLESGDLNLRNIKCAFLCK